MKIEECNGTSQDIRVTVSPEVLNLTYIRIATHENPNIYHGHSLDGSSWMTVQLS